MSQIRSKINPILTLDYMISEPENKYFDRKSAKIKPSDIADLISAFANAEGGTIVLGISDRKRVLEGINRIGEDKINDFISAPKDFCRPMPHCKEEILDIVNEGGENDRLLLLHIAASVDQVIRTKNDSTFLRVGDRTKELKGEDLRNLEYSKSTRHFEDECTDTVQMLRSRGFLKKTNGTFYLTNAAVLLFSKNIQQFYPNCRIRFVRYDGNAEKVGVNINIIKDVIIEFPILRIIDKTKEFIITQLREFTSLDLNTGRFQNVPEYPEFSWLEGIVNAVTHREYGMAGSYIKITMFDDRLEIQSPGKLPNIVSVENIQTTRYSRNPRIARVLTEFGWVRELNEGVKRIFSDMKDFYLSPPEYSEPEQTVKLILKNNIAMRSIRQKEKIADSIGEAAWDDLDDMERKILVYMASHKLVTTSELAALVERSGRTVGIRLKHLMDLNIIKRNGALTDPKQTYEMISK